MQSRGVAFLVLITLASAALVTIARTLPPSPMPANAPAAEFSAERAIEHIQTIAALPRLTHSPGYETARKYVLAELEKLGLETETQFSGALQNTIGWIEGYASSGIVLLTAHLDSVGESPGATDDASGVAVLLETARALKSAAPLRNTVMFLFTDYEEGGYVGAKAFVAQHPRAKDVRVVIGLDAGGIGGPDVLSATSPRNGWLIRQLAQADPYLTGSSAISALADSHTDFTGAFRPAGFSGYEFDLYWDRRIHTPADNIGNLNPASIQHQGDHALSLARHFGSLSQLADPREPDAVYFGILRMFTVSYSSTWAIPISMAITGVFGVILAYGLKRRILSWGGMGYGMFVVLVGLILTPLPNILLGSWISTITSKFANRSLAQPFQVSLILLIAIALVMLWVWLSCRGRSANLPDLTLGALALMALGMVGTSVALPALSYSFTWPLLFSLLACAFWFYGYARWNESRRVILALLLSGVGSLVIVVPVILLGSFDQMTLTLVMFGALCGFFVPHIHLMLGSTIGDTNDRQS